MAPSFALVTLASFNKKNWKLPLVHFWLTMHFSSSISVSASGRVVRLFGLGSDDVGLLSFDGPGDDIFFRIHFC